ncbi:hypothetical protein DFH07DRAFT_770839 [Mycena maculata]|uniref:Uncharacterized protein n=1 Tax=Mycena maculata TaxID=230809 RepID=A0AAD7NJQ6_9AGAR|nr:hypothetical protein DFH07DRAFT_770839 [Mycena maculata]
MPDSSYTWHLRYVQLSDGKMAPYFSSCASKPSNIRRSNPSSRSAFSPFNVVGSSLRTESPTEISERWVQSFRLGLWDLRWLDEKSSESTKISVVGEAEGYPQRQRLRRGQAERSMKALRGRKTSGQDFGIPRVIVSRAGALRRRRQRNDNAGLDQVRGQRQDVPMRLPCRIEFITGELVGRENHWDSTMFAEDADIEQTGAAWKQRMDSTPPWLCGSHWIHNLASDGSRSRWVKAAPVLKSAVYPT